MKNMGRREETEEKEKESKSFRKAVNERTKIAESSGTYLPKTKDSLRPNHPTTNKKGERGLKETGKRKALV